MWRTISVLGWLVCCTGSLSCRQEAEDRQFQDGSPGETVRTAEIVFLEGSVMVKRQNDLDWVPASQGMKVALNDKIRTLRDSFATIEFEEGGTLRMGPESLVKVSDLRIEPRNHARRSTFTLVEGRVEAELDAVDQPESEFKIRTPSAETSVVRREVAFQ